MAANAGRGQQMLAERAKPQVAAEEQAVTVIDQGRFGFTEFAMPLDGVHNEGLAVTGGVHVVEVVPSELACRSLTFPALDPALQVGPICSEGQPPPRRI